MRLIFDSEREKLRLNFGQYLCREFNSRHYEGERLFTFSVHWQSETVDPERPTDPKTKHAPQTLWNHQCYEKKVAPERPRERIEESKEYKKERVEEVRERKKGILEEQREGKREKVQPQELLNRAQ